MTHYRDPEAPTLPVCRIPRCPAPAGELVTSGEAVAGCTDCRRIEREYPLRLMTRAQHDQAAAAFRVLAW